MNDDAKPLEGHGESARRVWLGLERVRLYSAVVLLLFGLLVAVWAWHSEGFTDDTVSRPGADFAVFWSASYLALSEGPVQAYHIGRHLEIMNEFGPLGAGSTVVMPWLYPPTFLLLALPLALLPLPFSYLLFVAGSGYAYLRVVRAVLKAGAVQHRGLWLPVLAAPAVLLCAVLGQNALLTAALAGGAVVLLDKRPVLAGMLAGLLAMKPQLALLVPVALIAGHHWRALRSAIASAALFTGASVAICGWDTVPAFLHSTAWARENLMEGTSGAWYGMPSVLSAAQLLGLSSPAAYAVQAMAAVAAAVAVACVWSRTASVPLRAAALAAAALLATPYVRHYELTWMGIAVAGLAADGMRQRLSGSERLLFLAAWLLPVFEHANPLIGLPQIGPLVSALLVFDAVRRANVRAPLPAVSHAAGG